MEEEKYYEENLQTFILNDTEYRTLLTRKYLARKPFVPENPKLIKVFIPGTILEIPVKSGHKVKAGDPIIVFEAMKMNNIIVAPFNTTIKKINVKVGETVTKDTVLIELK